MSTSIYLSIDRAALEQVEREHLKDLLVVESSTSSSEERAAAAKRLKVTPRSVVTLICRVVRVKP